MTKQHEPLVEQGLDLADLTRLMAQNRQRRADLEAQYKEQRNYLDERWDMLANMRDMAVIGCDADTWMLAESLLRVTGPTSEETGGAFVDVLEAIAAGGGKLLTHDIGSKRYERFHQRCDVTPGFNPAHGHMVFRVGLTEEARKRGGLNPLEQNACIRYLLSKQWIEH